MAPLRSPLGGILPRHAEQTVAAALADTRVVLVQGARQVGKSTLLSLAAPADHEWRNLDNALTRAAATEDPVTFVDARVPLVIDEVQRVPDLMLAIKEKVDADGRPGQFLLSGSARLLGLRQVVDALPGRMETIELWPLSQGEIDGRPDGFVDAAFQYGSALRIRSAESRGDYVRRVLRGGFPEAVARDDVRRRGRFFASYLGDLVNRDVLQLSAIEHGPELRRMLGLLAANLAQPFVRARAASDLGVSRPTVDRYVALLREVFLIKEIPAWSRNLSRRAVGTAKLIFVDSGVGSHLAGSDAAGLTRIGGAFGPALESFVLAELARQLTWSQVQAELFHYRTKDGMEVDAVMENGRGEVVGLEVKASTTVRTDDFRGLRHLQARLGQDFKLGAVLYTGPETLSFGPGLLAVPVSALWETPAPR